jgi:CheY-like chemotaxis protein
MKVSALPSILVVEENSDDWLLIERRIRAAGAENPIKLFADGDEALDYLAGLIAAGNSPLPGVTFTDLKLLGTDGFGVIARIRQHPELNQMKVYVLSGSLNPAHRARALELGADGFLVKYPSKEVFAGIMGPLTGTG